MDYKSHAPDSCSGALTFVEAQAFPEARVIAADRIEWRGSSISRRVSGHCISSGWLPCGSSGPGVSSSLDGSSDAGGSIGSDTVKRVEIGDHLLRMSDCDLDCKFEL